MLKLHEISSCMTEVTLISSGHCCFSLECVQLVMYCSSAKAFNVQLLVTITCYVYTSLNLLLHAESMEVILAPNLPDLASTNDRYSSTIVCMCVCMSTS